MTALVTIGEFSRLSHLSVKALRHYHDVGLLEPVSIDPSSGYRWYGVDQAEAAHLIRRLRAMDMPVADVRALVDASDPGTRDRLLRAHLDRIQSTLERTGEVVSSLRAALDPLPTLSVEHRHLPAQPVALMRVVVSDAVIADFFAGAFPALYATLGEAGVLPSGPGGAICTQGFFEDRAGEVVAFVPVADTSVLVAGSRQELAVLEPVDVAVGIHAGPYGDFDRTYGALGRHVAHHCEASGAPIREHYLIGPDRTDDPGQYRTEVCWPIGLRT